MLPKGLSSGWGSLLIVIALSYFILVERLRFTRRRSLSARNGGSLNTMTMEDAFQIQLELGHLEFPQVFDVAIFFALFKVICDTYSSPMATMISY